MLSTVIYFGTSSPSVVFLLCCRPSCRLSPTLLLLDTFFQLSLHRSPLSTLPSHFLTRKSHREKTRAVTHSRTHSLAHSQNPRALTELTLRAHSKSSQRALAHSQSSAHDNPINQRSVDRVSSRVDTRSLSPLTFFLSRWLALCLPSCLNKCSVWMKRRLPEK